MMWSDFIRRKTRFGLWLVDAKPYDILKVSEGCGARESSSNIPAREQKAGNTKKSSTPTLSDEIVECSTHYIAVLKTSSEKRSYIPIDWLSNEVIPDYGLRIIPDATLYDSLRRYHFTRSYGVDAESRRTNENALQLL